MNPVREVARRLGLPHAVTFTVTHQACAASLMAIDVARPAARRGRGAGRAGAGGWRGRRPGPGSPSWCRTPRCPVRARAPAWWRRTGRGTGCCRSSPAAAASFDGRPASTRRCWWGSSGSYPEILAEVVLAAVEQAGLAAGRHHPCCCRTTSTRLSWRQLARRIGFPLERVLLDNVPVTGHSFAADAFLNHSHRGRARAARTGRALPHRRGRARRDGQRDGAAPLADSTGRADQMTEFTSERGLPLDHPAYVRGWAECRRALSGSQLMSDPAAAGYALKPTYNMLLLDGDLHQAVRRIVTAYLTRDRLGRGRAAAGRDRRRADPVAARTVRCGPDGRAGRSPSCWKGSYRRWRGAGRPPAAAGRARRPDGGAAGAGARRRTCAAGPRAPRCGRRSCSSGTAAPAPPPASTPRWRTPPGAGRSR